MAQNFEIVFNIEKPMMLADNTYKQWSLQDILDVLKDHNCKWLIAQHPVDDRSNFSHYHCGIHTTSNNEYATIAKWFNLPTNSVEKIKKKFESTYALYLIHYNQDGKTPIDPDSVLNNWNLDYAKLIASVEKGKRLPAILEGINSGDIKPYNYTDHITLEEYTKWKRQIDNAFAYRIDKLRRVERNMECIFITGDSGVGKTTYAKQICEQRHFTTYVSSGSNDVLDDYKGEEAIILDDLRPSCLSLSDLLKMLDNNTASSVKSRFKNKVLECKLIIITSTKAIDTFFSEVFENENETKIQLMRRCQLYINMTRDAMTVKMFNYKTREYETITTSPNLVTLKYQTEELTEEQKLQKVADILGATGDMFTSMKRGILTKEFIPDDSITF